MSPIGKVIGGGGLPIGSGLPNGSGIGLPIGSGLMIPLGSGMPDFTGSGLREFGLIGRLLANRLGINLDRRIEERVDRARMRAIMAFNDTLQVRGRVYVPLSPFLSGLSPRSGPLAGYRRIF